MQSKQLGFISVVENFTKKRPEKHADLFEPLKNVVTPLPLQKRCAPTFLSFSKLVICAVSFNSVQTTKMRGNIVVSAQKKRSHHRKTQRLLRHTFFVITTGTKSSPTKTVI